MTNFYIFKGDVPLIQEFSEKFNTSIVESVKGVPTQNRFQIGIYNLWSKLIDFENDPIDSVE